ncbi:MbeB family mobilization protein [Bisgaardia hudsonensis]|uniref:MbeB family mobilization protein n=1 Tax=Bisgaardia hudsonensis TaxID=109472 RepID=UPI001FB70DC2|nr:MbeB family mobilization protein [Bisgaardia hudsonensis]
MNKILDLAKNFQQTSKKELDNTKEIIGNVIKQHEKNLIEQLQNANKNLVENIQIEQKKLIKSTVRMYRLPTIIALSILAIIISISALLSWKSKITYQEMIEWQISTKIAKEATGGIKLDKCKTQLGEILTCVKIDKNYINTRWGEEKDLMILDIAQKKK